MLDAVIRSGENNLGTICFEHLDTPHHWQEDEIEFALKLADQFALALSNYERRQAEADRERLTQAIEQSGEIVVITNPDGSIQYVNPAFETTTGYTIAEVLGENPRILKSGEQDDIFYREMWIQLSRGIKWEGRMVNRKRMVPCTPRVQAYPRCLMLKEHSQLCAVNAISPNSSVCT